MDRDQLPAGMFTPERPSASGANDANMATLLSSPFLLFANALSPITPSRALLAQGVSDAQAAALTAFPARSPAPLCFSSPNHSRSTNASRHRSNLSKGAGGLDDPRGCSHVDADDTVLHDVSALAQSPLRTGTLHDVATYTLLRKQLENEFNVNLTEPESHLVRTVSSLERELLQLDDGPELGGRSPGLLGRSPGPGHQTARQRANLRGAAARGEGKGLARSGGGSSGGGGGSGRTPSGVGAVAHQAHEDLMNKGGDGGDDDGNDDDDDDSGGDAHKRSSTTGASMEWPHGISKMIKKDGDDSPRMHGGSAKSRAGGSAAGRHQLGASGSCSDRSGIKSSLKKERSSGSMLDCGSSGGGARGGGGSGMISWVVDEADRPNSAPGGTGTRRAAAAASVVAAVAAAAADGGRGSDRRVSVPAAATPSVRTERTPQTSDMSTEVLTTPSQATAGAGRGGGKEGAETPDSCASKKCNCKKSKCLKLYCECFAAGAFCDGCSCQNCQNTPDHADLVSATRQQIRARNPLAFADKIVATEEGGAGAGDARHKKGCHCKKSACLKKYCECFQAGVLCQEYCKCEGCKNNKDDCLPGGGKRGAEERVDMAFEGGASPTATAAAAAAAAAEEEAALVSDEEADLIIEELMNIQSPGRRTGGTVFAAAEEVGTFLPQSPLDPKSPLSGGGSGGSVGGFGGAGAMTPTPMKRADTFPSPLTPGSRTNTMLRAGPGRLTLNGSGGPLSMRSARKVPPPLFGDDEPARKAAVEAATAAAAAASEVTPTLSRSSMTGRTRAFMSLTSGHDSLSGGMIATLGSPVPLSTPEGFE